MYSGSIGSVIIAEKGDRFPVLEQDILVGMIREKVRDLLFKDALFLLKGIGHRYVLYNTTVMGHRLACMFASKRCTDDQDGAMRVCLPNNSPFCPTIPASRSIIGQSHGDSFELVDQHARGFVRVVAARVGGVAMVTGQQGASLVAAPAPTLALGNSPLGADDLALGPAETPREELGNVKSDSPAP